MTDDYPETIEFEIERDRVRRYLRMRWYLSWVGGLSVFGASFGLVFASRSLDSGVAEDFGGAVVVFLKGAGFGLLGSFVLSTLLYFLLSHWVAARFSSSLNLTVEGAFLRIVHSGYRHVDQKVHFRAIVDYIVVEEFLMSRFGIMVLGMTTIGSTIGVLGIKDCLKVRDMLAEIGAMRDNR